MPFNDGDTVQIWDTMCVDSGDQDDCLSEHGQVAVIVRRSEREDVPLDNGPPLGEDADECFFCAVPGKGLTHVNEAWLRHLATA